MIDDVETFRVDPPAGGFWEIGDFESRFPDGIANPWEHGSIMAPFDKKVRVTLFFSIKIVLLSHKEKYYMYIFIILSPCPLGS